MNSTLAGRPPTFESACSISAVCRCVSKPYADTFSFASENRLLVLSPRPAPETPDTASAMTRGSTSTSASNGAHARLTAVG